jgi:hypothetical protein
MEEKALEGRTPTRVRFDGWVFVYKELRFVVPLPGCVFGSSA